MSQKHQKSAQLLAQWCARSCALACTEHNPWLIAMYPHGYPHLSAQEVAQLQKMANLINNINKSQGTLNETLFYG